jgi:mRNA interferase HigB
LQLVNVLSIAAIRAFAAAHPEAEVVLRQWFNALRKHRPEHFAALKAVFSSVDVAHTKDDLLIFIFDVGGNKYRVIARLDFEAQMAFIVYVFTHEEYTRWNRAGRP